MEAIKGLQDVGVSKNKGTPKWMVYNGKPYQNGWFGDTPIFGNTHVYLWAVNQRGGWGFLQLRMV